MPEVLMVTKVLGPPWSDGTRVLVRDLVTHLERWDPIVGVPLFGAWRPPRGRVERFPTRGKGYASGWAERGALVGRLALGRGEAVRHFVFAPTAATAAVARASRRLRDIPIVQTIPSRPRTFDLGLAFGDRVVVPSRWSEARWRQAGLEEARLRRIPPGVALPPTPSAADRAAARRALSLPADAPTLLFAGDLGPDAMRVVDAFARGGEGARLLLASRRKTAADDERAQEIARRIRRRGVDDRVVWTGEVPRFATLLEAADVVALPAVDTYAKVDLPLAVLEAMAWGVPVVVDGRGPAAELAVGGGAWAVDGDEAGLAEAVGALLGDGALRARHGEAARATIARDHDPSQIARRYEALYDEVSG